jgi:pimeloyl-ACP methyl ester carboxylesterase
MSRSRRIDGAGGLSLAVTEAGEQESPAVLLVHGFPDTSAVLDPVVERLADSFHVVRYDVRGAGQSGVPATRAEYALPLLVEDMVAVVEATCPEKPVHLVAHDWGSIQGWEAVTTAAVASRFESYTSISGPPLDYAGLWARRHRTLRPSGLLRLARQALHSWYIALFQLPRIPELMARNSRATRMWARGLHRIEHAPTDPRWPAPTFSADFAHGVELYRANVRSRMRHPEARHTDVPVQLVIPLRDRYVTPAFLDDLDVWANEMRRCRIDAGHWVIRTNPDLIVSAVREFVSAVDNGAKSESVDAPIRGG